jgi:hypothetical protein
VPGPHDSWGITGQMGSLALYRTRARVGQQRINVYLQIKVTIEKVSNFVRVEHSRRQVSITQPMEVSHSKKIR